MPLGEPIPGYSGVNRRIQADNVFGMTYAEARKMAGESLGKVNQEKSETLKETSQWTTNSESDCEYLAVKMMEKGK